LGMFDSSSRYRLTKSKARCHGELNAPQYATLIV
jgi:hypothetical protein